MAESVACTSRRDAPAEAVVWIRPNQVAHGALLRHFLDSVGLSNLIETVYAWGEAAVQTEDLVLNDSRQGEVVKQFSEDLPHVGISVLAHALIVKSVAKGKRVRVSTACTHYY